MLDTIQASELRVPLQAEDELYNLYRLIELSPSSMQSLNGFQIRTAAQEALLKNRRGSDSIESTTDASLSDLSEDTQAYIQKMIRLNSEKHMRQAHFDALTHLPNRAYFLERLHKTILDLETSGFALLFLDLDGFKSVNDQYSHQVGDELLQLVSARLQSAVREEDFISRLGGDEFCIIVPDTNLDHLRQVCRRIISEVSCGYWIKNNQITISTSIGIALYPKDAKFASDLINYADQALYLSKRLGKQQVHFFEEVVKPDSEASNQSCQNALFQSVGTRLVTWQSDKDHQSLLVVEPEDSLIDESVAQFFRRLEQVDQLSMPALAEWLWDSGLFYLHQLPCLATDVCWIRFSANLFNQLPKSSYQPRVSLKGFGVVMRQADWENLDETGRANWSRLSAHHLQSACLVEKPWCFNWELVETFQFQNLLLDSDAKKTFLTKPAALQSLFVVSCEHLEMNVWTRS